MKRCLKCIALFVILFNWINAYAQFPELALTPPMGWNSYNTYGIDINAQKVMDAADAMLESGMAAAGYEYVVIDDGWQIARDENGRIVADSVRFPQGMKFVIDYVHAKGLKFGIYTDLGTMTCGSLPGSLGYEIIDAQTYADWGVDFIKADWCFTDGLDTRVQYKIFSDAIRATGRPMILSICEWGSTSPWEWGKGIGAMWRTTNDIQDCYDCVRSWGGAGWVPILEQNVNLAPFAGPGHWNDPDMLEVGNKSLNLIESRAHFSMWCMLAAPLIAGNTLSTMTDEIRDILTSPELIAINQDVLGKQATRIRSENGLQVWQKPLKDGSVAVALLNVTTEDAQMNFSLEEIGFSTGKKATIRDLWKQENLESIKDSYQTTVVAHGVEVFKVKGKKAQVSELKFDQPSIALLENNHATIQVNVKPSVTLVNVSTENKEIISLTLTGVNQYRIKALKEGEAIIKATSNNSKISDVCKVRVSGSNIPTPWVFTDVNDDKASATFENGAFTIEGGGNDIWGGLDQFAFVHQKGTNDANISVQITSQSNSHPWAKSGLMFRESDLPDSKFVMVSTTPGNGISLQWRESNGGTCMKKDFQRVSLPAYLKLDKSGAKFSAYRSINGNDWELLGDITLNEHFTQEYRIGMAVCAHTSHLLNTSIFENIKIENE